MTYQKDQTGILQTATKAAADLTAAEMAAGIIKSHDTAIERFDAIRAHVLVDLTAAVSADNEMFKAEEANSPAPARRGGAARKSAPAKGSSDIGDPGAVELKGKGKFAGLTVSEVNALTGEQSEAYGYVDKEGVGKPGSLYIQWLTTNDKNPFMQRVATQFIEGLRATSDAA